MKVLRIAALGLALVIGSAVTASAQGGGRGGRGNMTMVGIDSTLSAEQKGKIDEINKKYAPEQAAIRAEMATDREGAMKKSTELSAKRNAEIRAVLTPAQQAIFDKNLEEMAKRMSAPRPAAPPTLYVRRRTATCAGGRRFGAATLFAFPDARSV
jgi:Spy/CpxP family protein refolding chaperone